MMMSELHVDPNNAEGSVTPPVEGLQNDTNADLATATPEGGKEGAVTAEQESVRKAINRQHFKFREEQRRADGLETEIAKLRQELRTTSTDGLTDITIPPVPDAWDDNYGEKITVRDDAIRRKAAADAQAHQNTESNALADQRRQLEQTEQSNKLQAKFTGNAEKLGINAEALNAAQNTVIQYGITPELAVTILEDADGPLLVQHLAANPLDLHELVTLEPLRAGMKLAEVKIRAAALRPKGSNAPAPANAPKGRGAREGERGPAGATYS